MAARGRPGLQPQTEKGREFARLIEEGISISEASWRVGVAHKTGVRRRHGRAITTSRGVVHHYPSVIASPERDISARFLSSTT